MNFKKNSENVEIYLCECSSILHAGNWILRSWCNFFASYITIIFKSEKMFTLKTFFSNRLQIVSSEHREKLNQMAMECLKETGAGKGMTINRKKNVACYLKDWKMMEF